MSVAGQVVQLHVGVDAASKLRLPDSTDKARSWTAAATITCGLEVLVAGGDPRARGLAGEAQVAQGLVVDRKAAQVEPNSGLMLAMVPAAAPS